MKAWTKDTMNIVCEELGKYGTALTEKKIPTLAALEEARIIFTKITENGIGYGINMDISDYFKLNGFCVKPVDIGFSVEKGFETGAFQRVMTMAGYNK